MIVDQVSSDCIMMVMIAGRLLQVLFAPILFSCLLPLFGLSQGMNAHQIMDKLHRVSCDDMIMIW